MDSEDFDENLDEDHNMEESEAEDEQGPQGGSFKIGRYPKFKDKELESDDDFWRRMETDHQIPRGDLPALEALIRRLYANANWDFHESGDLYKSKMTSRPNGQGVIMQGWGADGAIE